MDATSGSVYGKMMTTDSSLLALNAPDNKRILARRGSIEDLHFVLEVMYLGTYDRLTIKELDCVADLGAQIGTFALSNAGHAARIVCVERNHDACTVLRRNLELAFDHRGVCLERTVSDVTIADREITVDDVADKVGIKFDVMKMDIEGDELRALHGCSRTLTSLRELIMEVHSPLLLAKVTERLESAGFRVVVVDGGHATHASKTPYKLTRMLGYLGPLLRFNLGNGPALPQILGTELKLFLSHLSTGGIARTNGGPMETCVIHAVRAATAR